jgi:hypothetical protein
MSGRGKAILLIVLIALGAGGLVALERSGIMGSGSDVVLFPDNVATRNVVAPVEAAPAFAGPEGGLYKLAIPIGDGRVREVVYPSEAACEAARRVEMAAFERRRARAERDARPGTERVWQVLPTCWAV